MSANYKNWVPNGMVMGFAAGTAALALGTSAAVLCGKKLGRAQMPLAGLLAAGSAMTALSTLWLKICQDRYSYDGSRQLSRQIIEGTAEYLDVPDGGIALDVGCGSGALTIACAKRNPGAKFIGIDRWGKEYASFSKELCESNAAEEGVTGNTEFMQGDAVHLDFDDETFDAVTSNYVYHNITGTDRKELLRETFRVLKKGGCFAIHDIMSKSKYGDIQAFADELRKEGFDSVSVIDTTKGKFMSPAEAALMGLGGSALLIGRK